MPAIPVVGMTCAGCAHHVARVFHEQGLTDARVNVALDEALLAEHPTAADFRRLRAALLAAGYDLGRESFRLSVSGAPDAAGVAALERLLLEIPGVLVAEMDASRERLQGSCVAGLTDIATLIRRLAEAGHDARVEQRQAPGEAPNPEPWWLLASSLLTLPFLVGMFGMLPGADWEIPGWLQWSLATPVQFVFGARFHRGAFTALRSGGANMDVLVSLGTNCAWLYSTSALLWPETTGGQLYFESAALVITLVRLGKYLETGAKLRAAGAIRKLGELAPAEAERLTSGGTERVPVEKLSLRDRVLVRPGSRLPVDGLVLEGSGEVDESLVTGESRPVDKQAGDRVFSGTLNGNGLLTVEVMAPAHETLLAKIARQVQEAQAEKPPVALLVDRISRVFVPAVLCIALGVFLFWWLSGGVFAFALMTGVSVLIVACPCALGLATPTAVVAGTGLAAQQGILMRDLAALETLPRLDRVAFDKTGTLTLGTPELVRLETTGKLPEKRLLQLAASVQQGSEHLLAKPFVQAAHRRKLELLPIEQFRSRPGLGVAAEVAGHRVLAGNAAFLADEGVALPAPPEAANTATRVLLAVDGELAGLAELRDQPRPGAEAAVAALQHIGLKVVMLSGDQEPAARELSLRLGLDEVHAGLLPEDKRRHIQTWQRDGLRVAMVGDGVNDAPALATADAGIAMGSGTDVAAETAGLVLVRPDPRLVAAAIRLSRLTMNRIRQNLFWAFAYNLLCIPLAGLGFLTPALAGAAMALSSVSVVANSLRLARTRIGD